MARNKTKVENFNDSRIKYDYYDQDHALDSSGFGANNGYHSDVDAVYDAGHHIHSSQYNYPDTMYQDRSGRGMPVREEYASNYLHYDDYVEPYTRPVGERSGYVPIQREQGSYGSAHFDGYNSAGQGENTGFDRDLHKNGYTGIGTGSSHNSFERTFGSKAFLSNSVKGSKSMHTEHLEITETPSSDERAQNIKDMQSFQDAANRRNGVPKSNIQETAFGDEGSHCHDIDTLSIHTVDIKATTPAFFTTSDIMRTLRQRRARNRKPELFHDQEKDQLDKQLHEAAHFPNLAQQLTKLHRQHNREQLMREVAPKSKGFTKWKYECSQEWESAKKSINEWYNNTELWRGSFKSIEGHFGSSVVSYFRFIKWLFFMNLFSSIMIACFIIIPQELVPPNNFNDTVWTPNVGAATAKLRLPICLFGLYEETDRRLPQVRLLDLMREERYGDDMTFGAEEASRCTGNYTDTLQTEIDEKNAGFHIIDFFLGKGWMENTVLFMGYYFNKTAFNEEEKEGISYNMPVAYLSVSVIYLLIILLLMVNYTGHGVKQAIVSSGDKFYRYSHKVFCGWDYSLSTEKAAKLKQKNLWNEYHNDLFEEKRELEKKNMGSCKKLWLFVLRLLVWLVVLGIWAGSFYLIVKSVSDWTPQLLGKQEVQDSVILSLLVEFLPSLTLTILNVLVPPIFQKIAIFEDYSPETEVRITIARTVILRLASVGFLSFSLHSKITSCDTSVCGNCPGETLCWETYVGQEFYKLVILDFFVIVGVSFFIEFPRRLIVSKFEHRWLFASLGYQEFDIPIGVLDIVYSQIICWVGGFFSPLIPAITVVKFFIFFYVKKLSALRNCIPASRPYRASRSNYFFMIILMISYGLCLLVISFAVGRIPPSQSCGPFRIYSGNVTEYFMYTAVSHAVDLTPAPVQTILGILANWVIYVILLFVLCLIIYYYQAKSAGSKRRVELLKEQLGLEGMDKQFLLKQVNDVIKRNTMASKG